jgi:hypothetical protein
MARVREDGLGVLAGVTIGTTALEKATRRSPAGREARPTRDSITIPSQLQLLS